jgi:oligoendopeptidase F
MPELTTPPRSAVPVERTWDAESVFASVGEWEAELEAVLGELPKLQALAGRLAEGPSVLAQALETRDSLRRRRGRVMTYAGLGWAVDTTNQDAAARRGRALTMVARVEAALSFIEPELLALGRDRALEWSKEFPLATYRHYLDDLFRRAEHVRSAEVEELLGSLVDVHAGPFAVHTGLVSTDLAFAPARGRSGERVEVTQGSIHGLLASHDRELRRSAWESFADGHRSVRNTLAANYATAIKQSVFTARARRHPSSLAGGLDESNISLAVFDNLIATFRRHLPTWHRYWAVRARALGLDSLRPYDLWAPLGAPPELEYDQCVEWICEALTPLGDEYVATVRRGCLEERWVDVYPNQGKFGGAFSAGSPGTHPFIVMSFDGSAGSLGALAHELGHSMHSYLAWKAQPQIYARYSIFVAEVASNFHQALVRAYLVRVVDDRDLLLAVIDEALSNFYRYFLLMPTLARFEREMHEGIERGEGLTADVLDGRMAELFAEAYGPQLDFDRERVAGTWAQFPHLYQPFYVYQYATGISGAHALARGVLDDEPGAAERYLDLLRAGGSDYPLEVLRAAGVDLAEPEPVEETFAVLASLVDRLEALTASA